MSLPFFILILADSLLISLLTHLEEERKMVSFFRLNLNPDKEICEIAVNENNDKYFKSRFFIRFISFSISIRILFLSIILISISVPIYFSKRNTAAKV